MSDIAGPSGSHGLGAGPHLGQHVDGPSPEPAAGPAGPSIGGIPGDKVGEFEQSIGPFRRGDIVFSAAAGIDALSDLNVAQIGDDFPRLAAFAQTVPYLQAAKIAGMTNVESSTTPYFFKPWFHVAVIAASETDDGPARVLGFEDEASATGVSGLARRPLKGVHDTIVLRAPHGVDVSAIAAAAETHVDTEYSVLGLLAFALATQARAMPTGAGRNQTLDMAYGASALAREIQPGGESCVTAVSRAVAAGMDEFFRFAEAPAFPTPTKSQQLGVGDGHLAEIATVTALLDILLDGQAAPATGDRQAVISDARDRAIQRLGNETLADLNGRLGQVEPPPDVVPVGPAPIVTLAVYLELLAEAVEQIVGTAALHGRDVAAIGAARRASEDVLGADELVASPAMLYDRLIAAGFTHHNGRSADPT